MKIHNYGNDYAFRRKLQEGIVDEKKVKRVRKEVTKEKQYDHNPAAGAEVIGTAEKVEQADTQESTAEAQPPKKEKGKKPQKQQVLP